MLRREAGIDNHRALAFLLLQLYLIAIMTYTLRPLGGGIDDSLLHILALIPQSDTLVNLLMYIPAGFLLYFAIPDVYLRRHMYAYPLLLSIILSSYCEFSQMFIPGRVPSIFDFMENIISSMAGFYIPRILRDVEQNY